MQNTSVFFIGWKQTFKRLVWYILISILLWVIVIYLNSGNVPKPQVQQYVEIGFIFLFIKSLYWAHLLFLHKSLPALENIPKVLRQIIEFFSVWFIGLICAFLFNFLPLLLIFGEEVISPRNYGNLRAAFTLAPVTSLILYYFVERAKVREQLQQEQIRIFKLQKEKYKAQLQTLKNQLSPHFLFNSLNVLTSIIPYDTPKSLEYTHRLSDLYHYFLQSGQEDIITLKKELELLAAYRFLLETRYGSQLQFSVNTPTALVNKWCIPPLVLQECIENAVKHNGSTKRNPLLIHIDLTHATLSVFNSKQPKRNEQISTEIGWKNIIERYRLLGIKLPYIEETDTTYKVYLPLLKQCDL